MKPKRQPEEAFTLVELLAVIAIIAILAGFLMSSLGAAKAKAQRTECLSNKKQLSLALHLYADDNGGRYVMNEPGGQPPAMNFVFPDGSPNLEYLALKPNWVNGWMSWKNTNDMTTVLLGNNSLLAAYVGRQARIYKCPSDNYLSAVQRPYGWVTRPRSVSLSMMVGNTSVADKDLYGGVEKYVRYSRFEDFRQPAGIFTFIDEHPDSLDEDSLFFVPPLAPGRNTWDSLPGSHHSGGATLSFGDGHAEYKKWLVAQTRQAVLYEPWYAGGLSSRIYKMESTDLRDRQWTREHSLEYKDGRNLD